MKTVSISGSPRANVGKTDAKSLRRKGIVPCVLYGGKEQVFFQADERVFTKLVYSPDVASVKLDIAGKSVDAILQEIQFHPVTDKIVHIDFLEVFPDKPVVMNIPIKIEGSAPGIQAGGKLQRKMRELKAKGLISKIPDSILINVSTMELGDAVKVKDLKYDGVSFLHPLENTVIAVRMTREVVEETPVAAAATTEAGTPAEGVAAAAAAPAAEGAKKKEEPKKEEKKK